MKAYPTSKRGPRCRDNPATDCPDELVLRLAPVLKRAYLRCAWIERIEKGRNPDELATEMVEDFLRKHGC